MTAGRRVVRPGGTGRRFRLASPAGALVLGGLVLVLMAADPPLAALAHQSISAGGGSVPVFVSAGLGAVGFVVAWRRPRNPLGWVLLASACFFVLAEDASFYTVADYRLRHGGLPLGWVALLAQPGWAPGIVLFGLAVLLFPDGRLPSPRWRWMVWLFLAVAALWIAGTMIVTVGAIIGHHTQVDSGGNLLLLGGSNASVGWWNVIQAAFFPLLAACGLASVASQVLSFRRSTGERRQQLKWLLTGSATTLAFVAARLTLFGGAVSVLPGAANTIASAVAFYAIPVSMAVAIFKYRLFDIDRIISRTLAYSIVTGLLVGVYGALVLLATRVVSITGSVAVAGSTLAAAALFSPLRRRVQRAVDRRFNRARYDADETLAAFAERLRDAVDLDAVRGDLEGVVHSALEPAHVGVWLSARG